MKEEKSQQMLKQSFLDEKKRYEELSNQFNSLQGTDRKYSFYQRQPSQSLYLSSKK
ncbi:unnamed protein product [Paramecium sonneborni]|uniref:Uncharacterized protein n=1 Tax=Paramecium sonneborni TaxID=65129 RepID=A0A8S1MBU6_9CILI|nr:unnamed protein product [Paramecium sonneborni]